MEKPKISSNEQYAINQLNQLRRVAEDKRLHEVNKDEFTPAEVKLTDFALNYFYQHCVELGQGKEARNKIAKWIPEWQPLLPFREPGSNAPYMESDAIVEAKKLIDNGLNGEGHAEAVNLPPLLNPDEYTPAYLDQIKRLLGLRADNQDDLTPEALTMIDKSIISMFKELPAGREKNDAARIIRTNTRGFFGKYRGLIQAKPKI